MILACRVKRQRDVAFPRAYTLYTCETHRYSMDERSVDSFAAPSASVIASGTPAILSARVENICD